MTFNTPRISTIATAPTNALEVTWSDRHRHRLWVSPSPNCHQSKKPNASAMPPVKAMARGMVPQVAATSLAAKPATIRPSPPQMDPQISQRGIRRLVNVNFTVSFGSMEWGLQLIMGEHSLRKINGSLLEAE